MLVTGGVSEKYQGDAVGESILTGFGSSSGSSTDEMSEQEEFLDELTRQMAEHMLQEEDGEKETNINKHKTTLFEPNNVVQNKLQGKKYGQPKEHVGGSTRAGFMSSTAVPNGSGMRVVFLGDQSGSRNGSVGGTGVFIPQAQPTKTLLRHQPRKNPGRVSRVLIPERVLHSLKQHHERRNASRAHPNALFHPHENQRLHHQETPNKTVVNSNKDDHADDAELQLPREWTY